MIQVGFQYSLKLAILSPLIVILAIKDIQKNLKILILRKIQTYIRIYFEVIFNCGDTYR